MFLTDFTSPLRRREYVVAGFGLAALKYVVDAAAIYAVTGLRWTPIDYVLPSIAIRGDKMAQFPLGLSAFLILWTLPFMWAGVALSVRRSRDAGVTLWAILFFFVPLLNYAYMASLSLRDSDPSAGEPDLYDLPSTEPDRAMAIGVVAGVAAALLASTICVVVFRWYGSMLFLGTPFLLGAVTAYSAHRIRPAGARQAILLSLLSVTVASMMLVGIALEGILCVLMALPIATPVAVLGSLTGRAIAMVGPPRATGLLLAVGLFPAAPAIERQLVQPAERVVMTSVDVDAPPESVWRHVVTFSEIDAPPGWLFRAGLAYPLRARIDGSGPGAVRYCEFSTGAFREPITVWDEPRRLAFDVTAQPAPLREWSPYSRVYAPHVDGFFRTSRGEFKLVPLPGGRTRLEGRTWYSLDMAPALYWMPIADTVIHTIHRRVLDHISSQAAGGR